MDKQPASTRAQIGAQAWNLLLTDIRLVQWHQAEWRAAGNVGEPPWLWLSFEDSEALLAHCEEPS